MPHPATIVITGATDGLGKALATELVRQEGLRFILHGRSRDRLARLGDELSAQPDEVLTVQADLAQMADVHALADEITARTEYVSVLVNNAGVGGGEPDGTTRQLTVDGKSCALPSTTSLPSASPKRCSGCLTAEHPPASSTSRRSARRRSTSAISPCGTTTAASAPTASQSSR